MDQPRHTRALSQPPPFLARCALSTIFFLNGVVLASWVPHIPAVKARHALGDGQLGVLQLPREGAALDQEIDLNAG